MEENLDQDSELWSAMTKKPALLRRLLSDFEEDDETINPTFESNYLDASTVPTYEEFTGAKVQALSKTPFAAHQQPASSDQHGFANSTSASMMAPKNAVYHHRHIFDTLSPVMDNTGILSEDEDSEATSLSNSKKKLLIEANLGNSIEEEEDADANNKENRHSHSFLTNDSNCLTNEFSSLSIKNIDETNISMRRRPSIPRPMPMTLPPKFKSKVAVIFDSPPQAESRAPTLTLTPNAGGLRQAGLANVMATAPANRNYASSLIQAFQKPIATLSKRLFPQTPVRSAQDDSMNSSSEYLACENKQIQTSFGTSFAEDSPARRSPQPDEFAFKKPDDLTTTNNFKLRLSSSSSQSSATSDEAPESKEPDLPKNKKKLDKLRRSILVMNSNHDLPKIDVKKRASMCSVGMPKQLIEADESILDELENDEDEKNGFIYTLYTSAIEEEIEPDEVERPQAQTPNPVLVVETSDESEAEDERFKNAKGPEETANKTNYTEFEDFLIQHHVKTKLDDDRPKDEDPSIIEVEDDGDESKVGRSSLLNESSDEEPPKPVAKPAKKKTSDEDSDDKFERFLREQREKASNVKPAPVITKKKMDSFIVDDDDEIDEVESESSSDAKGKKPSSTSKKEPIEVTSSDDEVDHRDLQLFYIRATKKKFEDKTKPTPKSVKATKKQPEEKVTPKPKTTKAKKNVGRSSLLDGSSSSEASIISVHSTSSLDTSSSSMDDSFRRRFRLPEAKPVDSNSFRTPSTRNIPSQDTRLVKTQATKKKLEMVQEPRTYSFVDSFTQKLENHRKDSEALQYLNNFKKKATKDELLRRFYKEFNKHAFDNRLPDDMKLTWSKRLTSTAGYCRNKITADGKYTSAIEISMKICDTAERLRDTLAHEMCHAACNIINKRLNEGHGPVWKSWTYRVNTLFRHMPPITVHHTYEIKKKFIYKCTTCSNEIRRHSKSIDVNKQGCGFCHGRFVLLKNDDQGQLQSFEDQKYDRVVHGAGTIDSDDDHQAADILAPGTPRQPQAPKQTPARTPNKFALFVKENYNNVKKEKNLATHKDVMQELSKNFKSLSTK